MIYTYLNSEGANHPRTEALVKTLVKESVELNTPLISFTSMSSSVFKSDNGEIPPTVLAFEVQNFDELFYVVKSASEKSVVVCSILDQLGSPEDLTGVSRMTTKFCELARGKGIDLYLFSRRGHNRLMYGSDFVQNLETGAVLKNRYVALRPIVTQYTNLA